MIKKFISKFNLFVLVLAVVSCAEIKAFASEDFKILSVDLNDSLKTFTIKGNSTSEDIFVRTINLSNPYRTIIDIQGAVSTIPKYSIDLKKNIFTNIKLAQYSVKPNTVRVVFTANSEKELTKLKLIRSNNSLVFDFNAKNLNQPLILPNKSLPNNLKLSSLKKEEPTIDLPSKNVLNSLTDKPQEESGIPLHSTEAPKVKISDLKKDNKSDKQIEKIESSKETIKTDNKLSDNQNFIVDAVNRKNDQVIISGIGNVTLREPFILKTPDRIVFDLVDSTPKSGQLSSDFTFKNGDKLRVGQFDEKTTRIVIETKTPELYKRVFIPAQTQLNTQKQSTILIAAANNLNLASYATTNLPAKIKDINVEKIDEKTTTLKLSATVPLVYNIQKHDNKVNLEFYNLQILYPDILKMKKLTSTYQFKKIESDLILGVKEGACLTIALEKQTDIETKISPDNKTIELVLKNEGKPTSIIEQKKEKKAVNNTPKIHAAGKVVIDAGHGGSDCGATRNGIYEKTITLDVANLVRKELLKAGVPVIMTRTDDRTLSLNDRTVITNNERPDLFVSIHVNSCVNSYATGLETHWYHPQSLDLAKIVHQNLTNAIKSPNRGVINSKFYVINHTPVPAILVEIGFISNDYERCSLLTRERQEKTAKAIAKGILSYLDKKYGK